MTVNAGNILGNKLSTQERSSLKYMSYSVDKDSIVMQKDVSTTGVSSLGEQHQLYSAGENVFFYNASTNIAWQPVWGGIKDQSVPENQDTSGILVHTERLYSDDLIFSERNGDVTTGVVPYGETFTPTEASSFHYVQIKLKMSLEVGNIIHYHVHSGSDVTGKILFQFSHTVDSPMAVDDLIELWPKIPFEARIGTTYTTEAHVESFLNSGITNPLLVAESVITGRHWANFGYRTFTDAPIFSGHDMTPLEVNTDTSIIRYGQYGVNAAGGTVTLTVDESQDLQAFVVFDLNETFSPTTKCIVDFGGGITFSMQTKSISYLFYKSGATWRYINYGYGNAFTVPGF